MREVVDMPLWGWDSSHYDAPNQLAAVGEGFSFFTHKVGGDALDSEYVNWWAYMKTINPAAVMLGGYWVLYPGSPVSRADQFVARLDAVSAGWRDRPYILQADCEIWGGNTGTLPSVAEINAFGDRLAALAPKLRMIAYAPKWCYGSGLGALKYPIWSSRYVTGAGPASTLYPGDSSALWGAYSGGVTPAVLQFSSSATIAGQTTCDANAFRGSMADLVALLAPGWKGTLMDWADDVIPNLSWRGDYKTNPTVSAKFAISDAWNTAHNANVAADRATAAATAAGVAATAAVAALGKTIADGQAQVLAAVAAIAQQLTTLPPGGAPATPDALADGFELLLRRLVAAAATVKGESIELVLRRAYDESMEGQATDAEQTRPETLEDVDRRTAEQRTAAQHRILGEGGGQ